MPRPELLAPAGEWDALVAAVQNGADAVYLGGRNFSARRMAANFGRDELARAVDYAHVRGVKIYVTVNTLIADTEMEDAANFLRFLYNNGVDAVIVQDLGLIKLAREVVPDLELHASTQMTVHNVPAAGLLRQAGITRIVLARELSLREIKEIRERAQVEVEVFIHGALCICYSGQCLMSSMIGGRSGNRGLCAQPCRLQYTLEDESGSALSSPAEPGEYILSPRDLNLSGHLPELIKAGIEAFKIEGRMKRPEYVATVTRIYRNLIDRAVENNFYITPREAGELAQIFNRDFTPGYIFGSPGRDMMSFKRSNNRGVLLGRVKKYFKDRGLLQLKLEMPLRVGDGLEVWVSRGGRLGIEVRRMWKGNREVKEAEAGETVSIEARGDLQSGDRVFKTHDAELIARARETYASDRETKKIPVHFYAEAAAGSPLSLTVRDADGFTGRAATAVECQPAINRPLTREFLLKQLDRLGNTPYCLEDLSCRVNSAVMVPVREINEVRRQALDELSRRRAAAGRPKPVPGEEFRRKLDRVKLAVSARPQDSGGKPLLTVSVADLASLRAAARAGADVIYFGGDGFRSREKVSPGHLEEAHSICSAQGARLALSTPRIMHECDWPTFQPLWEKAQTLPLDGVLVSNLGCLECAARNHSLPFYTDFSLNAFNNLTAYYLLQKGARRVTLSTELTLGQVREITGHDLPVEVLVHGAVPLMVSAYCAPGGVLGRREGKSACSRPCRNLRVKLRDRKGYVFPVEVDHYCRMHVFNSRELCLAGNLDEICRAGVTACRVDARLYDAQSTGAVVGVYRELLDRLAAGRVEKGFLEQAENELKKYTRSGFTKGHYFRGVVH